MAMSGTRYVCSVDIGGTKVASALVRYDGGDARPEVVGNTEVPTEAALGGGHVVSQVEAAIAAMLDAAPATVSGIGIGSAGVVDYRHGRIAYANDIMPGWGGTELGPIVSERFGLPVTVMGDVHAHALGEARWGVGRGCESILCLGIGTGVGGAYVENGHVLRGFHGAAGHLGHIECSAAAGMPCACGRTGHLESIVSGTSIGRAFESLYGRIDPDRPVVGRDVNDLVLAGDERAIKIVHNAGVALGRSLGSLANAFDPELIVLSGGVIHQGTEWRSEAWRTSVAEGYASMALDPLQKTDIVIGRLEGLAPLIGAAEDLLDSLK